MLAHSTLTEPLLPGEFEKKYIPTLGVEPQTARAVHCLFLIWGAAQYLVPRCGSAPTAVHHELPGGLVMSLVPDGRLSDPTSDQFLEYFFPEWFSKTMEEFDYPFETHVILGKAGRGTSKWNP